MHFFYLAMIKFPSIHESLLGEPIEFSTGETLLLVALVRVTVSESRYKVVYGRAEGTTLTPYKRVWSRASTERRQTLQVHPYTLPRPIRLYFERCGTITT